MQSPSPPANIVDAIVIGLVQVLAPGFEALAQLIFATLIAGPALATMILLWLEGRVQLFRTTKAATGIAAVVLSLIGGYVFAWAAASLSEVFDAQDGIYQWVLPAALVLAVCALLLQWRAYATFSTTRAIGVACAVLTPLALIATDALL